MADPSACRGLLRAARLLPCLLLGAQPGCALIAGVKDGELDPNAGAGAAGAGGVGGSGYFEAVVADSPVAYWRLGEEIPPTAFDASGSGYDGQYVGSTITLGQQGAIAGDPDTAIHFTGTSTGQIDMGDVLGFPGKQPFTFELWAKPDDMDGAVAGKHTWDGDKYLGYAFLIPGGSEVYYFRRNSLRVSAPLRFDGYSHLVGTYDGSFIYIYQDGEEVARQDATDDVPDMTAPFRIGETDNWGRYEGMVDEVAVYDYRLLPDRIRAHYQAGSGR
jgi:hypothetical protein